MMQMLLTFAGLVMCTSAMLSLLPQGGLRRTASLVAGLMILSAWFVSVAGTMVLPSLPELPETLFSGLNIAPIQDRQAAMLECYTDTAGR